MNARIKKEVRLVAPMFGVTALLCIVLSRLFTGHDAWGIVTTIFCGCCAAMGSISFGGEFSSRTLTLLLSQPVPRRRLWFEKMAVLGVALVAGMGILFLCLAFIIKVEARPESYLEAAGLVAGVLVCVFCASPATALIARTIGGAMAASIVLPAALWLGLQLVAWAASWLTSHPGEPVLAEFFENHIGGCVGTLVALYGAGIYWFGYAIFMEYQVIDAQQQELSLPAALESALGRWLKKIIPGYTGPLASLTRKELQLQRPCFIIAAVVLVALICEALAWKLHPTEIAIGFMMATLGIYVLCLPLVAGVVSIAEERNWGTLGWQLTLPVPPWKQWATKIGVSLSTAVTLGIVAPILLVMAGHWMLGMPAALEWPTKDPAFWDVQAPIGALAYLLIFNLIIFASSVSPNTTRAAIFYMGSAMVTGELIWLSSVAADWLLRDQPIRHSATPEMVEQFAFFVFLLEVFSIVLIALVGYMGFANFRKGELNLRRTWIQSAVYVATCGCFALGLQILRVMVDKA